MSSKQVDNTTSEQILSSIESTVDRMIPVSLVVVLFIVVVGLFFRDFYTSYKAAFGLLDNVVIGIFTIDLGFKLHRASSWEGFLKEHWLEVIAILPAFIVYRVIEGFFIAVEYVEKGQHVAHLLEGARSGRLATFARTSQLTRSERLARFVKVISRSPRLAKASDFYESPDHHSLFSSPT
ncbi:hypothetical protein GLU01_00915 [Nanohaloarchaea archaeon]|nr:hypothetical protein [Candidatus Nanohaloarchaea archaeon]